MPSASAAGGTPQLPSSLQADHLEFAKALSASTGREGTDINVLQVLTNFGLLVHAHADRFGLISKRDKSSLFTRHVLDSLNPISLFDHPPASALDVGSGAGFPGIPLAAVWPSTIVTLLESREKKAAFLEKVVRELALKNVKVVPSRLEDLVARYLGGESRAGVPLGSQGANAGSGVPLGSQGANAGSASPGPGFDSVFVRALSALPTLLGRLEPLCAPGARWVYFLGAGSSADEIVAGLQPLGLSADVATGQFGGQLLHGRFGGGSR